MKLLGLALGVLFTARTVYAQVPFVNTRPATAITATTVTLVSVIDPRNQPTTGWFEYGPTTAYGATTASQPAGTSGDISLTFIVTGLTCAASYHYRAVANNASGTSTGGDVSFTMAACGSGGGGIPPGPSGTATLAWDPNSEPDLAGYLVSWGEQATPPNYTTTVDAQLTTTYIVPIPDVNKSWCYAVRAYDTVGLISNFSASVCKVAAAITAPATPLAYSIP